MGRRKFRESLVAVDWGSRSLRAVQLARAAGGSRVIHWLNVETTPSAGAQLASESEATIPASRPSLSIGLDQFQSRRVGMVINTPDVGYCLLKVPDALWKQDQHTLINGIRWEVGQQLSRNAEESEIGAWPLPEPMRSGSNAMAVAAERSHIAAEVRAMISERLDCACVEPAAPALIRSCRAAAKCGDGEIWGVADLGHTGNRLYLAIDSTVIFARQVPGGGDAWTRVIANELHVSPALAEDHKRRNGIAADARGHQSALGMAAPLSQGEMPGVLLAILKSLLGETVADIERAFRFVMEQYPQRQVGSLVLVGGGARMPGLAAWLSGHLGIRVAAAESAGTLQLDEFHPLSRLDLFSVMAECVGLAMGDLD